ncbi:uncharacterized protein B0H18DRAFT_1125280 [Fomitopsis serialis]|uniref:uncharacterized protein n=1 Tax=Fomitopsis serialis TaxID=139415 RepID=UPI002008C646|nr:uncharacterized protein B0H18DRAFT_1125280 [Neoantrodia serialis]KAH9914840.1 hypothetical protein B0H18DRAFT_1125280 [Neoantrodia serialis]
MAGDAFTRAFAAGAPVNPSSAQIPDAFPQPITMQDVLMLAGRAQAALEAPAKERRVAEVALHAELYRYWPSMAEAADTNRIRLPYVLAAACDGLLGWPFKTLDGVSEIVAKSKSQPKNEPLPLIPRELIQELDYSREAASSVGWWRQEANNRDTPGPSNAGEGSRTKKRARILDPVPEKNTEDEEQAKKRRRSTPEKAPAPKQGARNTRNTRKTKIKSPEFVSDSEEEELLPPPGKDDAALSKEARAEDAEPEEEEAGPSKTGRRRSGASSPQALRTRSKSKSDDKTSLQPAKDVGGSAGKTVMKTGAVKPPVKAPLSKGKSAGPSSIRKERDEVPPASAGSRRKAPTVEVDEVEVNKAEIEAEKNGRAGDVIIPPVECDRCVHLGKKCLFVVEKSKKAPSGTVIVARCTACKIGKVPCSLVPRHMIDGSVFKNAVAGVAAIKWRKMVRVLKASGAVYPEVPIWNGAKGQWVADLDTWDDTKDEVSAAVVDWIERRKIAKLKGRLADPPYLPKKGDGDTDSDQDRQVSGSGKKKKQAQQKSPPAVEQRPTPESETADDDVQMAEVKIEPEPEEAALPTGEVLVSALLLLCSLAVRLNFSKTETLSARAAGKRPAKPLKSFREMDRDSVISISDDEAVPPTHERARSLDEEGSPDAPMPPLPPPPGPSRSHTADSNAGPSLGMSPFDKAALPWTLLPQSTGQPVSVEQLNSQVVENNEIRAKLAEILKGRPPEVDAFTMELRELRSEVRTTAESTAQRFDEIHARLDDLARSQVSVETRLREAENARRWSEVTANAVQQGMQATIRRTEEIEGRMRAEMEVGPVAPLRAPPAGPSQPHFGPSFPPLRVANLRGPPPHPAKPCPVHPLWVSSSLYPKATMFPCLRRLPGRTPGSGDQSRLSRRSAPRVTPPTFAALARYGSLVSSERASSASPSDAELRASKPEQQADSPTFDQTPQTSRSQSIEARTVEESDQLGVEATDKGVGAADNGGGDQSENDDGRDVSAKDLGGEQPVESGGELGMDLSE